MSAFVGLSLLVDVGTIPTSQAADRPAMPLPVAVKSQEDRDGDGQPDVTVLAASFFNYTGPGTLIDTVTVYDYGNDMETSTDWWTATDFENDLWLFDTQSDGTTQLIIKFERIGRLWLAKFFVDQNGDDQVNYRIETNGALSVFETTVTTLFDTVALPIITAQTQSGWFLPDGRPNWNITFQSDGPGLTLRDPKFYSGNLTSIWDRYFAYDGIPDVETEFHDADFDGVPEYGLWRVVGPTPLDSSWTRTWLWSNEGQVMPPPHTIYYFWPFLTPPEHFIIGRTYNPAQIEESRVARRYFDEPPRIEINLLDGEISPVTFKGYPVEHGFHLNTNPYFTKRTVNYADFEIGQNYFDLAQDRDGNPELHIRHRHFAKNDRFGWELPEAINDIRYSWNQSNRAGLTFDFKLGLAGRQIVTDQIDFPDFSYYAIPFDKIATWVTNETWDFGSFIAVEAGGYVSSEGIYDWSAIETILNDDPSRISRYLAGQLLARLSEGFQELRPGLRGDFSSLLRSQPYLYMSAVDRKLHLKGADYCLWQIDQTRQLKCQNTNDDSYLDQWAYYEDGQLMRELYQLKGYLVYRDSNEILIKDVKAPQSLFETLPPVDTETWLDLSERLAMQPAFAPDDLRGMFDQFPGAIMRINGADLTDLRTTDEGFKFKLDLKPEYTIFSQLGVEGLNTACVGTFALRIADAKLTLEPMSPPDIAITSIAIKDHTGSLTSQTVILQQVQVEVWMENRGLRNAENLWVEMYAQQGDVITLLGEGPWNAEGTLARRAWTVWAPDRPGEWAVRFKIYDRTGVNVEVPLAAAEPSSDPSGDVAADGPSAEATPAPINRGILLVETMAPITVVESSSAIFTLLALGGDQPLGGAFSLILLVATALGATLLFSLFFTQLRPAPIVSVADGSEDSDTLDEAELLTAADPSDSESLAR